MAPHSSTLAWKIPWTEELGGLQSMGSRRVGHDWETSLFTFHFRVLEKEMATHSSFLAWRIPGTGEPGGLPSMGSHRVNHDGCDLAVAATSCFEDEETRSKVFKWPACSYTAEQGKPLSSLISWFSSLVAPSQFLSKTLFFHLCLKR